MNLPKLLLVACFSIVSLIALAQSKKVITHDVYDKWESLGERGISKDGNHVMYAINPQEGDGNLYIATAKGKQLIQIPRGSGAAFTHDSKYVIGRIKAPFKETRDAKIKKKKPDEMPKDTMFIYNLADDKIVKIAKVKTFKMPIKGADWVAYHLEKAAPEKPKAGVQPDSLTQINSVLRMADSLRKVADSLVLKTKEVKDKGLSVLIPPKKETKPAAKPEEPVEEGTELVLRNLSTEKEQTFKLVKEYQFNETGNVMLLVTSKKNGDSTKQAAILKHNLATATTDTIFRKFNEVKNFTIDDKGEQIAFVVERDSATKALQKFYKLGYHKTGMSEAKLNFDRSTASMPIGFTVSPDYRNTFSKDGKQLYFGITPIRKPKDTTLVDFETARLDVWHYNDDYLQPQQLIQMQQELRRSDMMVMHPADNKVVRLGSDSTENIQMVNEGNASYVFASSNKGKRVESQWLGYAPSSGYVIDNQTGNAKSIYKNIRGFASPSPMGKFIAWYDWNKRLYFSYNVATQKIVNFTKGIKTPLFDEDDDHPDAPPPHGSMGWTENDAFVYIYDKYDIWKCDPNGVAAPVKTTNGRDRRIITRFQDVDAEDRFIVTNKSQLFATFSEETKKRDIVITKDIDNIKVGEPLMSSMLRGFTRAENKETSFIYTTETPQTAPKLVHYSIDLDGAEGKDAVTLFTQPNPQQAAYNWLTTELVRWKMFDGKISEGILYKPEDFDPKKKYPIIFYFYERDADDLFNYRGPAPSASTVNIPYFTSNGYLVFDPNIYYKNGEPGESAYNSIVSAAKHLSKNKWVDSTKMAIQGQSWGGYQVAYLVTRTNMFAAAGAGAPVANMTSAYGGIRWGSGLNRQFQYEHSQSRLGATLWERRDLYIKNSPLFFADKVKTPLLMMHNDKDGAVPWYQGIEYFTALRRLNKKVWMLQYNDEDHNLVERRNRKDLSVRLGQFFDHYLKGKPMPTWMSKGVPAVDKGIEWGLEMK